MSVKKDEFNFANNDTIYNKYLDDLKKYYVLKNKYNKIKETFKNKLLNSKDSLEVKKKLYAKKKFGCVNCKQEGGTVFLENEDGMKASCGNIQKPCDLNIVVAKCYTKNIESMLIDYNNKLTSIKKEISLLKIQFLFGYLEEDKAVEVFETKKSELKLLQESYNNLLMLYNSIVDDEDKNNLIQSKSLEQHNYIEEYKEFMKIFRESQEHRYLNDAVNVYKTKIVEVNKLLMELKYKVNTVEIDEEITTLIQKKYYPNDLEILIKQ